MTTRRWRKLLFVFLLVGVMLSLLASVTVAMVVPSTSDETNVTSPLMDDNHQIGSDVSSPSLPPRQEVDELKPIVRSSVKNGVSRALRDLPTSASIYLRGVSQNGQPQVLRDIGSQALPWVGHSIVERALGQHDPLLQSYAPALNMPTTVQNFEGINNLNGVLPPDTNGDVGPNHYVQWVNLSLAVWDKQGNLLMGPVNGNSLWAGFGGICETNNDGDPIVLYDEVADRWMLSQFALEFPDDFHQCIAVSQTGDPTGAYYLYDFLMSTTKMNDYPHFGVWPDGYYMSINQFDGTTFNWAGAGAVVFERSQMLQGQPARMVYFDLSSVDMNYGGQLPSDLDGVAPPTGAPNYFMQFDNTTDSNLLLWAFHVDWTTPASSTFGTGAPGAPNFSIPVTAFDSNMCGGARNCIPQPDTNQGLDVIADRLMYRVQYRNFGSYQTLVANHTVDVGSDHAGVRWYELRDSGSGWALYQEGTYAPDNDHRWMGSMAMDKAGNIALGYSVAGDNLYPSIRYTGRLDGDPLGVMTQGETTMISGGGSQTHSASRWGDYSMMGVDPDGCTFWYTQEYIQSTGAAPWQTRIGAFRLPSCTIVGMGSISGTVFDGSTTTPIENAIVEANHFSVATDQLGSYQLTNVPTGTYTVTARAYGYMPGVVTGATVYSGTVVNVNFDLTPVPMVVISGTITDVNTGWPLYAQIDVSAFGGFADTVFSDPVTGDYSVTLAQGITHTFNVQSLISGYVAEIRSVVPPAGGGTENFALDVDATTCEAPGYDNTSGCHQSPGGLVVGNVYDNNFSFPVNRAGINNEDGYVAITVATPNDPAVDDGFYAIFSPVGTKTFTATMDGYSPGIQTPTVVQSDTIRQDFNLDAGHLSYSPNGLAVTLELGANAARQLALSNNGSANANFEFLELDKGMTPLGPFETPLVIVKPFKQSRSTAPTPPAPPPAAPPYAAGDEIRSWSTGTTAPWGIAFDGYNVTVWVGEGWGNSTINEFSLGGTSTGRTQSFTWAPTYGPADAAFNHNTGMLWIMDVGDDNCIHEIDPVVGVTGNTICPTFGVSQRGLAYDPTTDTYYAGGWNDQMVHHFAADGTLLSSVNVGLSISGLAYNADTQHLFAQTNGGTNDVYVLDVADNYNIIGQFHIGSLVGGAGLEIGPDGSLWAVDQSSDTVIQSESGESTTMFEFDIPWLSENPISGTVVSLSSLSTTVTFDAAYVSQPGTYHAQLKINNDTPYNLSNVPVTMTVTVPSNWGKLQGVVTGLGHCDTAPEQLEGATVFLESASGVTWTLTTSVSGTYQIWMDETNSPLTASVSYPEYITGTATSIVVSAGVTTTQNFDLRLNAPCITTEPDNIEVWVITGTSVYTHDTGITITNGGGGDLEFEFFEANERYTSTLQAQPGTPVTPYAPPPDSSETPNSLKQFDGASAGVNNRETSAPSPLIPISVLLNQVPNQNNGFFSDAHCDGCSGGTQVVAENFTITQMQTIGQIVLWGGYYPDDTPINPDHFTVIFHEDSGGVPGATIATATDVPYVRTQTGVILFGVHEWMYTLTLNTSISLSPGNYWVEIYNDTGTATDDFFWETGDVDTIGNGLMGSAWATSAPGSGWNYDSNTELAIQLMTVDEDVPWVWEEPISGTVASDTDTNVNIMFTAVNTDSTPMALGTYSATLYISNNDTRAGIQSTPVVMHIVEPVTLTVNIVGNGVVTPTVGTYIYASGTNALLAAEPAVGWQFDGWTGDFTSSNLTDTVTMDSNKVVTATFSAITHTLTMNMIGNGVITPVIGTHVYTEGRVVPLMAEPAVGWQFDGWTGDFTSSNLTDTVTMDSNKVVTATFSEIPIYGVNLTILTEPQSGDAGAIVTYTVRITNTGNGADIFDITAAGGSNGWTTTPLVSTLSLSTGENAEIQFTVQIPSDAVDGEIDTATITATSRGDNTESADASIVTTANVAPAPGTLIYLPLVIK